MAVTPYVTLAALKQALGLPVAAGPNDAALNQALASATVRINNSCNRPGTGFNLDAAVTARVFQARDPEWLLVNDIGDLTGLAVATGQVGAFTNAIAAADFEPQPLNAYAIGRTVEVLHHHWAWWPTWPSVRIQVTAKWGWPAVPDPIVQACLILSARLFDRRNSPGGIANAGDFGPIRVTRQDPDVLDLISEYQRPGFA